MRKVDYTRTAHCSAGIDDQVRIGTTRANFRMLGDRWPNGRVGWPVLVWAVVAVGAVTLILPRGRETREPTLQTEAAKEESGTLEAANALWEQAFAAQMAGRRDEAIGLYEKFLELRPRHRQATFNLAYAYAYGDGGTEEDRRRSGTLFKRVLEIDPDYTEALFHLATVNWQLEQAREAIKYDRLYLERGDNEELKVASRSRLAKGGEAG